jgi:hypothetical protein
MEDTSVVVEASDTSVVIKDEVCEPIIKEDEKKKVRFDEDKLHEQKESDLNEHTKNLAEGINTIISAVHLCQKNGLFKLEDAFQYQEVLNIVNKEFTYLVAIAKSTLATPVSDVVYD